MKSTTAFAVGAAIGAGLATLFASKPGERLREDFTGKMTESIQRGQAKAREIADKAIRVADQAKDKAFRAADQARDQVQRVQEAVDAGVRAFNETKAKNSSTLT
jgi:gas vesicle protein